MEFFDQGIICIGLVNKVQICFFYFFLYVADIRLKRKNVILFFNLRFFDIVVINGM